MQANTTGKADGAANSRPPEGGYQGAEPPATANNNEQVEITHAHILVMHGRELFVL
jgi:hypothetical protein